MMERMVKGKSKILCECMFVKTGGVSRRGNCDIEFLLYSNPRRYLLA